MELSKLYKEGVIKISGRFKNRYIGRGKTKKQILAENALKPKCPECNRTLETSRHVNNKLACINFRCNKFLK